MIGRPHRDPGSDAGRRHPRRRPGQRPSGAFARRLSERSERRDLGSVALEFALVLPAVIALLFTSVQVGLYSFARSVALTAAEEGANAQRAYGAAGNAGQSAAARLLRGQGDTLRDWKVSVTTVNGEVRVTVTGLTQSVFPGFDGYHVRQTASGPVERFVR
ncbi:MAG TPA: TadE/TadG family type IV pilus assembly protein [Micromonosporaceae bacterium]